MLKDFLRNWSPLPGETGQPPQVAALPYAVVGGEVVFLLVTTRASGRWIFPKGGIGRNLTPAESAAREAFEEAGVKGEVWEAPIGRYRAALGEGGSRLADVDLYPLLVTKQFDDWPEQADRYRHWALLGEVRRLLNRRRPAALAARLRQQVLSRPRAR